MHVNLLYKLYNLILVPARGKNQGNALMTMIWVASIQGRDSYLPQS